MILRRIPNLHPHKQDGFTMIITLGVMLVTSLLLVAAFTASNGDISLSHESTIQKQAYYAALAGVQEYEYELENNPNYWQTCATPEKLVSQQESERYEIKLLGANGNTTCNSASPFKSMIEQSGAQANTFRIKSIGCAGVSKLTTCAGQPHNTVAKREIVATFQVTGFLDYVYFTQYETEDPGLYNPTANCEKYHNAGRSSECTTIVFAGEDNVKGPMHTDDSADACGKVEFGRKGHSPADTIEINGGVYASGCGGEGSAPVFNTANKNYSKGAELVAPESDTSLGFYVEPVNKFVGVTQLTLNGAASTITVVNGGVEKTIAWPENGLLYVENNEQSAEPCAYTYTPNESDESIEKTKETNCGNVYVSGTYSKSLTIAGENDVIVKGNIYPTSVAGKLGSAPTGTETLGLIASQYVRIYHPVKTTYKAISGKCQSGDSKINSTECEFTNNEESCDAPNLSAAEDTLNKWGSLNNPWVYAAILSTSHSFIVDNYNCGEKLSELNLYGALAQKFRGIVGTFGYSGGTGYIKDYNYDERLATDEPPYFIAPLKAGWRVVRETTPAG